MPQTIVVTVAPDGSATIGTTGFTGPTCKQATAELERALGVVRQDMPTAEMYQQAPAPAGRVQVRGGGRG